jgi:predicted O-linked N-acetylglucosamine transferase (SPINDLY family)
MGDLDAAIGMFQHAVRIKPDFSAAREEIAFIIGSKGDHAEAIAACESALAANPNLKFVKTLRFLSSANLCDWKRYEEDAAAVIDNLEGDRPEVRLPSVYLMLPASAGQQLRAATIFSQEFSGDVSQTTTKHPSKCDRIKVAYVSSDFREHPTTYLIAGVFEHHDRSQFEIIGISTGPKASGSITDRINQAVDKFYDVSSKSDDEVDALLRQLEIDIAVDLNGYTKGMRPGLFARRPAPVQVNYIGYPGTLGSRYIDYIIADHTVVPPAEDKFYSEKIARLHDTFQPSDNKRPRPDYPMTRAQFGLPPDGVVFCCFNNIYKITPDAFDVWMRLLNNVRGSVLWLLEGNASTKINLLKEAEKRGIASDRLNFAPRVGYADYLARYRLADLFLDTLHYNAGATASDALWMGLPIITREGQTFASRMASSLLHAIEMPELIATSIEDYEALALKIASDPDLLKSTKDKLARNSLDTPLFDTAKYTRNLEAAFITMVERHRRGEQPASFAVQP